MIKVNTSVLANTTLIGCIDYPESWVHFSRQTTDTIMYFIISGEMFLQVGEVKYHLKANDMITILPQEFHSGYKSAKCFYYYIHFNHAAIETVYIEQKMLLESLAAIRKGWLSDEVNCPFTPEQGTGYFPKQYHFSLTSTLTEITKCLDECIYKLIHSFPYFKIELSVKTNVVLLILVKSYLNDMLDSKQSRKSKSYQQVYAIVGFLNQNYSTHIDRYTIEKLTNMNYDYINREFKKSTNKTIMDYLTALRIEKAKTLATSSTFSFYEIGELIGYENQYYFSKLFKRETGMTLSEYVKLFHE